jgi:hypothetical protein
VGGVLAVLLGVSATGIAVNAAWLGGRWDASHAATDLAARLQKLDGVTAATAKYDPLGLPNPTMVAEVAFAVDAPPADWSAATALVRAAASTPTLAGTTSTADFHQAGSKTRVTVEPLLFTPAAVEAEIAAWRELRHDVGDRVSLHLGYSTATNMPSGPIMREYTVASATDARAVAANWPDSLPSLDPAIPSSWSGPGMQIAGMPSKPMMTTLSAIGALLPLGSGTPGLPLGSGVPGAEETGTLAVILHSFDGYKLTIVSLHDGKAAQAKPSANMARAAQAAFATGANTVEWESADGFRSLVSGDCPSFTAGPQTIQTAFHRDDRDTAFAAELARLGFVQPPEVRAGTCR